MRNCPPCITGSDVYISSKPWYHSVCYQVVTYQEVSYEFTLSFIDPVFELWFRQEILKE